MYEVIGSYRGRHQVVMFEWPDSANGGKLTITWRKLPRGYKHYYAYPKMGWRDWLWLNWLWLTSKSVEIHKEVWGEHHG
jgi:hypothetical protein